MNTSVRGVAATRRVWFDWKNSVVGDSVFFRESHRGLLILYNYLRAGINMREFTEPRTSDLSMSFIQIRLYIILNFGDISCIKTSFCRKFSNMPINELAIGRTVTVHKTLRNFQNCFIPRGCCHLVLAKK